MKIRLDFVSNSSSCSFVLNRRAGLAISALAEAVKGVELVWGDLDDMAVKLFVRGKTGKAAVERAFRKSDFAEDEIAVEQSWCDDKEYVARLTLRQLVGMKFDGEALKAVKRMSFEVEDCSNETLELYFLYDFFVRAGFAPDRRDSENDFGRRIDFIKALSAPAAGAAERYRAGQKAGGRRKTE